MISPEDAATLFRVELDSPASDIRLNNPRPNIIVIMTDDQPYSTINYMPTVRNELMANGAVFEHMLTTTPLCSPSRASMLTGAYAHNHGVYTNRPPDGGAGKLRDDATLPVWLQQSGYRTTYFGKYINEYEQLEPRGYSTMVWHPSWPCLNLPPWTRIRL